MLYDLDIAPAAVSSTKSQGGYPTRSNPVRTGTELDVSGVWRTVTDGESGAAAFDFDLVATS
jgi:hypothetical protein